MKRSDMLPKARTRRSGESVKIIRALRPGGIFVWCNEQLTYPKSLAVSIGRTDIEIVGPDWLEQERYRWRELSDIAVDHAARLTDRQWDCYLQSKARVRLAR